MGQAKELKMGVDCPSPTQTEMADRTETLKVTIGKYLPEFVKGVRQAAREKEGAMLLHQDAFAAGLDGDEYTLLGMAVKYAGLHGVDVIITG